MTMPVRCQGFKFLNAHYNSAVACSSFFYWQIYYFYSIKHKLNSGGVLRYIQKIFVYKSLKTMEIYTHITQKRISKLKSPLDNLNLNNGDKNNDIEK